MKISKQNKNGKLIKLYRIKTFALKKKINKKDLPHQVENKNARAPSYLFCVA